MGNHALLGVSGNFAQEFVLESLLISYLMVSSPLFFDVFSGFSFFQQNLDFGPFKCDFLKFPRLLWNSPLLNLISPYFLPVTPYLALINAIGLFRDISCFRIPFFVYLNNRLTRNFQVKKNYDFRENGVKNMGK